LAPSDSADAEPAGWRKGPNGAIRFRWRHLGSEIWGQTPSKWGLTPVLICFAPSNSADAEPAGWRKGPNGAIRFRWRHLGSDPK